LRDSIRAQITASGESTGQEKTHQSGRPQMGQRWRCDTLIHFVLIKCIRSSFLKVARAVASGAGLFVAHGPVMELDSQIGRSLFRPPKLCLTLAWCLAVHHALAVGASDEAGECLAGGIPAATNAQGFKQKTLDAALRPSPDSWDRNVVFLRQLGKRNAGFRQKIVHEKILFLEGSK
jgi:hypothetical protein